MCQKEMEKGRMRRIQKVDKRQERPFLSYIVIIYPFSLQANLHQRVESSCKITHQRNHDQGHPELEQCASQDTEPHAAWNRERLKAMKLKCEADIGSGKWEVGGTSNDG